MNVLITGANSGFGYLSVLKFARDGHHVYACTRKLESDGVGRLNVIAKEENLSIEWFVLDITKQEQIDMVIKRVEEKGLDVLVNNAGFGIIGPVEMVSMEDIYRQMETNYFGTVRMIKSFIPLLKKSMGRIINTSSIAGLLVAPTYGIYSASKYALEGISEALRYELKQFGIRVVLIEPSGFNTNFGHNVIGKSSDEYVGTEYEEISKKMNLGLPVRSLDQENIIVRLIKNPELVSNAIYRAASVKNPKLRYVVGVDGVLITTLKKLLPNSMWVWLVEFLFS